MTRTEWPWVIRGVPFVDGLKKTNSEPAQEKATA